MRKPYLGVAMLGVVVLHPQTAHTTKPLAPHGDPAKPYLAVAVLGVWA
jgi:hypothetical protein